MLRRLSRRTGGTCTAPPSFPVACQGDLRGGGGASVAPSSTCFGPRRVWGSQGSGTGVAGVRPTSSRPTTSPLFPPLLLLQQCGGEGEGEGEGMEWVTSLAVACPFAAVPALLPCLLLLLLVYPCRLCSAQTLAAGSYGGVLEYICNCR
ncbi:unnamed protein product [Closterium sp. NIES-54]